MKILLVTEFFPDHKKLVFSGGVETRAFFISKYLAKKNSVTVISRRLEGQEETESFGNLKIIRIGKAQKNPIANSSSLLPRFLFQLQAYKLGLQKKADLVEGSNFVTYLPAYLIAKKLGVPGVAWYPDVFKNKWRELFGLLLGLLGEINERLALSLKWDGIIAISGSTKQKLKKEGVFGKVQVISCGVDKSEFNKNIKKSNKPTIITISRLVNYKNVDSVIKAASSLNRKIKNLQVFIVGEGPEEANLKKLVKTLKIGSTVTFKKRLDRQDLLLLLASSHVLCHPSQEEGFGIAILEGIASKTPYVASKISAISEITRGGLGGILFEAQNIKMLEDSLLKLLTDKKLYERCQTQGLELVRNYYWEKLSLETEDFYKELSA